MQRKIIKGLTMVETNTLIGSQFPAFTLPATQNDICSNETLTRQFVLFVYPADGTPSCTKEAISFSQNVKNFDELNTTVIGLSKDGITKHRNFVEKNELKINLLSDVNLELIKPLGCWKEKSMYGKPYMGTERTTFLISKDGLFKHIWNKVKVPGHVEEVLNIVKQLR